MAIQETHRTRAIAILTEAYGQSGWTITAGRFHAAHPAARLEDHDLGSLERAVEVVQRGRDPVGYNNPLDGRGLYYAPLVVRVGYVLTGAGDAYDATGEQSGAATLAAVEDRAASDAHDVETCLGYQPNWPGLDPSVIDCEPDPAGRPPGWLTVLTDRVIAEIPLRMTLKATLPGSYGPALT